MTPAEATTYLLARSEADPNSGCWLWTGAVNAKGYGRATFSGEAVKAHRLAYRLFGGELGNGHVCHRCDTPSCVNPDHLWLGTNTDNVRDKIAKGRQPPADGERNNRAKLTADDVKDVRASSETNTEAARRLGVTRKAVAFARDGTNWKTV